MLRDAVHIFKAMLGFIRRDYGFLTPLPKIA
jgi:hypothetical protein